MNKYGINIFFKLIEKKINNNNYFKKKVYTTDVALYRRTFYNDTNKKLVYNARKKNFKFFIDYIENVYKIQTELHFDEYFEHRPGLQFIFNELKAFDKKQTILDVGCGNCRLLKEIEKLGHEITGVDACAKRINENNDEIKDLRCGFAEKLPVNSNTIDIIIATELLEHSIDLEQALKEFYRVLKPNGKLFIQVPFENLVDCTNHLRLFNVDTLNYWVKRFFKVNEIKIIPYTEGSKPNNIFLKAEKSNEIDIEFYLIDAFEIYHFLPIYNELKKYDNINVKFVCEPTETNTLGKWFDYETALKILIDLNLEYSTTVNPNVEMAISTQHSRILRKYLNTKVNLQYGAGLNKSNFCSTNLATEGYDFRLIYGKYTKNKIKKFISNKNIYEIGLPKQDGGFKNPLEKKQILNELSINTQKPILVYFPTWDEDISISKFYEELKKLKEKFFIITKAHHCTFRLDEKQSDLKKLYDISDIVLAGNFDFAKAAMLGDIALIDAKSGATTEVPYLNINLPILYLSVKENLKKYYAHDIFNFGYLINNPKNLLKMVTTVFNNDKFIKKRMKTIEYYMGLRDGQSTERALHAIFEILNRKKAKHN